MLLGFSLRPLPWAGFNHRFAARYGNNSSHHIQKQEHAEAEMIISSCSVLFFSVRNTVPEGCSLSPLTSHWPELCHMIASNQSLASGMEPS